MIGSIEIESDLRAQLLADPRIPAPDEIAIKVDGGTVTLRGTVGSFAQRRAAVSDARNTEGVYDVFDELNVRLLDAYQREDAEIRGAALQWLMWDIEVPSDSVDVKVTDGWVTLTGDVDFQFESDCAFDDVASLFGVVGVTNEIRVIEGV
jgi:osmotically-inducible protein OsmY